MRNLLSVLLTILLVIGLVGCGDNTVTPTDTVVTPTNEIPSVISMPDPVSSKEESSRPVASSNAQKAPVKEKETVSSQEDQPEEIIIYTVALMQFDSTYSSKEAVQGFRDGLGELLESSGRYVTKDAGGDVAMCESILKQLIDDGVDMIMTDGPIATKLAASLTKDIPIVATSIPDFPALLGLSEGTKVSGGNVTGYSNRVDAKEQVAQIQQLLPEAKAVGLLQFDQEETVAYQNKQMQAACQAAGLTCEVYSSAQEAAQACDVIFVGNDPNGLKNGDAIWEVCKTNQIPLVTCDQSLLRSYGCFGVCADDYEVGLLAGHEASRILIQKNNPGEMEFGKPISSYKMYHHENCQLLGISTPAEYTPVG